MSLCFVIYPKGPKLLKLLKLVYFTAVQDYKPKVEVKHTVDEQPAHQRSVEGKNAYEDEEVGRPKMRPTKKKFRPSARLNSERRWEKNRDRQKMLREKPNGGSSKTVALGCLSSSLVTSEYIHAVSPIYVLFLHIPQLQYPWYGFTKELPKGR